MWHLSVIPHNQQKSSEGVVTPMIKVFVNEENDNGC